MCGCHPTEIGQTAPCFVVYPHQYNLVSLLINTTGTWCKPLMRMPTQSHHPPAVCAFNSVPDSEVLCSHTHTHTHTEICYLSCWAASILCSGIHSHHIECRHSILNMGHYLQPSVISSLWCGQQESTNGNIAAEKCTIDTDAARITLDLDCLDTAKVDIYSNIRHIHALNCVIQRPISSIYPEKKILRYESLDTILDYQVQLATKSNHVDSNTSDEAKGRTVAPKSFCSLSLQTATSCVLSLAADVGDPSLISSTTCSTLPNPAATVLSTQLQLTTVSVTQTVIHEPFFFFLLHQCPTELRNSLATKLY